LFGVNRPDFPDPWRPASCYSDSDHAVQSGPRVMRRADMNRNIMCECGGCILEYLM
jgi:hypothetical protein